MSAWKPLCFRCDRKPIAHGVMCADCGALIDVLDVLAGGDMWWEDLVAETACATYEVLQAAEQAGFVTVRRIKTRDLYEITETGAAQV